MYAVVTTGGKQYRVEAGSELTSDHLLLAALHEPRGAMARILGEAGVSPERVRTMREGLARVARDLGPPGGSERAARAVLEAVEPGAAPGLAAIP